TGSVTRTGGKLGKVAFAHQSAILRVAYADQSTLVTAGEDQLVKTWDAATLQEKHVFPKQPDWPSALAVSAHGGLIAVGTHNGALTLFDATGKSLRRPFAGHAVAMGSSNGDKMPKTSSIPGRRLGDQKQR